MRAFYCFDRFFEYPTKIDGGYSGKRSNFFASLFRFSQTLIENQNNSPEDPFLSQKWYRPRSPPRKSEPDSIHFQIFGGMAMCNGNVHKNFRKNFFNLDSPLQGYLLGLPLRSSKRGVSA